MELGGAGDRAIAALPLLAMATGDARVYFWSPRDGPSYADVPMGDGLDDSSGTLVGAGTGMDLGAASVGGNRRYLSTVTSVEWSTDGSRLLLNGREGSSLCTVSFGLHGSVDYIEF